MRFLRRRRNCSCVFSEETGERQPNNRCPVHKGCAICGKQYPLVPFDGQPPDPDERKPWPRPDSPPTCGQCVDVE